MRQYSRGITIEFDGLRNQLEGTIYYCYVNGNYEKGWTLLCNGAVVPTIRAAIQAWMGRLTPTQKLLAVAGGITVKEYKRRPIRWFVAEAEFRHHISFPYPKGGL